MSETLWYLAGIIFIIIGIAFSIGLHELGHLIPAKAFGVKVTKYMIGFGPTLFSRKKGETEYGVKAIPLGGYIAMLGMYPPAKKPETKTGFFPDMIAQARLAHSEEETPKDKNRKFYQLPVGKRMIIMLGGPFMNLVLGVLLTVVSLSGFGVFQSSLKIDAVSVCLDSTQTSCSASKQTPAHLAGLKAGDEIFSIDGKPAEDWVQIRKILTETPTVELEVLTAPQPFLGVFLIPERIPVSIGASLEASGNVMLQIGQLILQLPQKIFEVTASTLGYGERDPNGPISIVGIGAIAGEVAASEQTEFSDKLATGISILGSLNFALFVFNMLPLLPLDGGHVAGGVYESIKRGVYKVLGKKDPGPADTALLMPLTWVVFIALMAVSLLLITADLINPISLFG